MQAQNVCMTPMLKLIPGWAAISDPDLENVTITVSNYIELIQK